MKKNSNIFNWILVITWATIIFILSSISTVAVAQFFALDFFIKKTAHIVEYSILYFLLYRATGKKYVLSFILTILYAATDEFHQSFVMGRSSSILDVGFDSVGAIISAYTIWKFTHIHYNKPKK